MAHSSQAVLGPVESSGRPCTVAKLRKADAEVRRAFSTPAGRAPTLYAQAAEELDRWRWLKEDASPEQWERASHALDADAEIDAMRRWE